MELYWITFSDGEHADDIALLDPTKPLKPQALEWYAAYHDLDLEDEPYFTEDDIDAVYPTREVTDVAGNTFILKWEPKIVCDHTDLDEWMDGSSKCRGCGLYTPGLAFGG